MVKQKRALQKGTVPILLLVLLSFLLLAGCRAKKNLPFYQFEDSKNSVLIVDGTRYIENTEVISQYDYYDRLYWKFTGEIGDTIGVCGGDDAERGGSYDVCKVKGDEECCFFFVRPNYYVIGPYITYILAREDLQITLPTVENVSSVAVVYNNNEHAPTQVDSPAMIAVLLEAFNGSTVQAPNLEGGEWVSLVIDHKDFPFLQCKIKCCYLMEQETVYCQNKDREWFALPAEWCEVISEHDFPTRSE